MWSCAAAHTAIYNSRKGTWSAGPDFPDGLGIADGPAALEPNGKVLMMASPGVFSTPSVFLEWDGRNLKEIAGPPNAAIDWRSAPTRFWLPSVTSAGPKRIFSSDPTVPL